MWVIPIALIASWFAAFRSEELARRRTLAHWSDILAAGRSAGVPPELVAGIVQKESGGRPNVTGAGKYYGLGQMSLATARSMGYTGAASGLYVPSVNLNLVARYLARMWGLFGNDWTLAISAYNAGPGTLSRWNRQPRNTNYVNAVMRYANSFVVWARLPGSDDAVA